MADAVVTPSPEQANPAPAQEQPKQPVSVDPAVLDTIRGNPEALSNLLAGLDDNAFSKLEVVNKRVDRFVTHKSQELEKQAKERDRKRQEENDKLARERFTAQQFVAQVEALPANQRGDVLIKQPALAVQYQQAKELLKSGGPDEYAVIDRVWSKIRPKLEEAYGIDLKNASDLEETINMAIESASDKRIKELEKALEDKFNAKMTELSSGLLRGSAQPDKGASTGSGLGDKREYTRSEIKQMSLAEYRAAKDDIDAAVREGRIK